MSKNPWRKHLRDALHWLTGAADTPISTKPGLLRFPLTSAGNPLPVIYLSHYTEEISHHIHRAKYGADWATAMALTRQMQSLPAELAWRAQCARLVPIPPDPERLRTRGFHLPALLAKGLGAHWQMAISVGALKKVHTSPEQARRSRQARQAMDAGVFIATGRSLRQGQPAVLIDDVMTTGATLRAAAQAWQRHGGEVLGAVVLAYVPAAGGPPPKRSSREAGHEQAPPQADQKRWHTGLWERAEGIR
jgi:predicted amidophosphoribosyltransferase